MNKDIQKNIGGFAIFSGYNQRGIIAFCRFGTENNIPFYIISSGQNDPIHKTRYAENVVYNRKDPKMEVNPISEILMKIIQENGLNQLYILPSSEYLNRFFLKYKKIFDGLNVNIPLVKEQLYNEISDKYCFEKLCQKFDLKSPKEYNTMEDITFPCVLKPKRYLDTATKQIFDKPIIIYNTKELDKVLDKYDMSKYYLQEHIDGTCLYLLYYISKGKNHVLFSQENLIQQDKGKSMIAAVPSNLHTKAISEKYLGLFTKIGFTGLVMVELKHQNGEYYMIEANPRLWGPSQLFLDANIPIFHRFVQELGFKTKRSTNTHIESTKYFWYGGITEDASCGNHLKYYDYSPERLVNEMPEWLTHEIYKRDDTHQIFLQENSKDSISTINELNI